MIVALAAPVTAALLAAALPASALVYPEARADAPWCAAVLAIRTGRPAPTCGDPAIAALVQRGARCALAGTFGGTLVSLEGPPELERAFVAALTPHEGALFVEARGAGPAAPADEPAQVQLAKRAAPRGIVLALAPSAALFGLEGAALALLLEDALAQAPARAGNPRVVVDAERAQVVFSLDASDSDAARLVRDAIDKLAARPPAAGVAQRLWTRARGQLAARDAVVGARAAVRARAWLATGSGRIDSVADADADLLWARLRARVFAGALSVATQGSGVGPAPAAAPAAASPSAPAPPAH